MFVTLFQFLLGFVVGLSGALIPGPLLAFVLDDTMRRGWKSGPLSALGHSAAEVVLLFLISLGLAALVTPALKRAIGVIGGVALLIVSTLMLRTALSGELKVQRSARTRYGPVLGGVAFTVFNPTWMPWWITVGLSQLMYAFEVASIVGALTWVAGHLCSDIGWFSFVSISVDRGGRYLGAGSHRVITAACALFLLVLGCYFVLRYATPTF
ncbi:MAG: LysE family transporter [Candidatus Bathyarchaeia archaeon]